MGHISPTSQGIEGFLELANGTKVPYSLKFLQTDNVGNIFSTIKENATKIKDGVALGKLEASILGNTYLRVNVTKFTKAQIVDQYNLSMSFANPTGFINTFGEAGIFKQIKIIDKDGVEVIFNNYNLIN